MQNSLGYALSLLLACNGVKSQFVFMGQLSADYRTARVKVWRRKHVGKLTLGPSKLGKPRAREGPSVRKPSETSGSRRKRNVGKPSERSGSRRKRREAIGNVGKPSERSGSRRKRREAIRNVGKPSETSGRRREAVGNVGKPSETPGSRRKAGGQFSETAECQHE